MDENEKSSYVEAGRIAFEALTKGISKIKKGESIQLILKEIEEFIKSKGAMLAFPPQIAVNSVAAHYYPVEEQPVISEGDVVKLDVGVCVDGYIADTARTVSINADDNLVKASEDALRVALKKIRPGVTLSEIGGSIQEVITSYGFSPIRNLSGHSLGRYNVHEPPSIPNFDTGDETTLSEGQVIAVEPFASTGAGVVYESSNPTIFSLKKEKPVRNPITRSVLQEIKSYKGLPFTSKWLIDKFGAGKTRFALRELTNNSVIEGHPPLIDKLKGNVSQAEHSVIVRDKPIIYTKGGQD